MKGTIVLIAAGSLSLLLCKGEYFVENPVELVVEESLLLRLQTLAEGLAKEIVLCLEGQVIRDTAYVDSFYMPAPRLSMSTASSFDPCKETTLAVWHNHPPKPEASSVSYCVVGESDSSTILRLQYPFSVISVDISTWCWWALNEVRTFVEESSLPGRPRPDRLVKHSGLSFTTDDDHERY